MIDRMSRPRSDDSGRRRCAARAIALPLLALCCFAGSVPAQDRPNILLLLADDLGVDGVGVYGEGANPAPTPNIDALAARGVLFRNAWVNPLCSPTRACIQTGRYAHRTMVGNLVEMGGGELPLRETTLPELLDLAGSGYRHALIGKWHLGETQGGKLAPNLAGWSHFAGFFDGKTPYFFWDRTVDGVTSTVPTYTTTQMVDDALAWIGEQQNPWLCVVAFNAPHTPLTAPPRGLHTQRLPDVVPELAPVPFFRAMVQALDTEIGRLLASLGDLDRTWVIFMSDNGAGAWAVEPPFVGSHGKGTPYEGGTRVPLIVAGPMIRSPGREVDALVAGVDVFNTVADLAGINAREFVPSWQELDGVSIVPYLRNPEQPAVRDTVYAELFSGTTWAAVNTNGFATVRDARFKLIRTFTPGTTGEPSHRDELYDLRADPFEASDLLLGTLTGDQAARYHALVVALQRQRRPRGTWHELGAPECAGSAGVPSIDVGGAPAVGRAHRVLLHGAAPGTTALLLVGTSHTQWAGVPLPLALEPFGGGHGCVLRGSGEAAVATRTGDLGDAAVAIAIPGDLALVGTALFHTWLDFDPAAPGALGITVSNTGVAVLGLPDAPPERDQPAMR
jgi:arylsulfatase A-like enzyme